MSRILAAWAAACAIVLAGAPPRQVSAQEWNDERTRLLVERATARRAEQLADTGLVDYTSTARGYLTFLAQVGEGFPDPPKIVKADQLALEVYWRAPGLSKQRIVGRRDTLLLPTDINYHRDHLGIVQNNFPSVIRLGDGDEVRDVPHPLSAAGLAAYDYQIGDSLRIQLPDRGIVVYEVRIRPKDDRQPAAVGAVYVDTAEAQVVRMAFSFTRAALKDRQLEDVSIVLENALIENRFWLPRRQEIEIRRTGSWLDYPARGIIRGRWEICCYKVNVGLQPSVFAGPEIVPAPRAQMDRYVWGGRLLDSLPPDVRAVTDEDVRRVQEEARELVRAGALARSRSGGVAARGISDFVRINRVEGLALGFGLRQRFGGGLFASGNARYGLDDERLKGTATLGWRRADGLGIEAAWWRTHRDVGDVPETSTIRNSIAAQEFGSDWTNPVGVSGAGLALDLAPLELPVVAGTMLRLEAAWERHEPLAVHASPSRGRYEPTLPAWRVEGPVAVVRAVRPTALSLFGTEARVSGVLRAGAPRDRADADTADPFGRLFLLAEVERPFGARRLVLRTSFAGVTGGRVPLQEMAFLGGPVSAPGYDFHELVGRVALSQRVEWRTPVPFPSLPLGRYGNTGRAATLAPFVHGAWVGRPELGRAGWHPGVGVGLLTVFDLLRFDVARGLRNGRWTFGVDVSGDFWRIL